jgi:hypothetical protein
VQLELLELLALNYIRREGESMDSRYKNFDDGCYFNSEVENHVTMPDLDQKLKELFRFSAFRAGQKMEEDDSEALRLAARAALLRIG